MGGKQSRQDRKGGPSLEEVATARRHKQETEGNLRSTSSAFLCVGACCFKKERHVHARAGVSSLAEQPPLPPPPPPGREDNGLKGALKGAEATAEHLQEQARTQDNRPYFGPASPAEPFVPMAPDNLYPRKYFERGQLHIVNEGAHYHD
eukprot:1138503-Pelagomonas_calceolata.AAC.6